MATIEDMIKQYEKDPALRKEIANILQDGKVTPMEFIAFAKKHDVEVSLADFPEIIKQAKEAGLIK